MDLWLHCSDGDFCSIEPLNHTLQPSQQRPGMEDSPGDVLRWVFVFSHSLTSCTPSAAKAGKVRLFQSLKWWHNHVNESRCHCPTGADKTLVFKPGCCRNPTATFSNSSQSLPRTSERCIIPPMSFWSSAVSPPSWAYPKDLQWEISGRHPDQVLQPLQWYSEFLLVVKRLPVSLRLRTSHSLNFISATCIQHLILLVTIQYSWPKLRAKLSVFHSNNWIHFYKHTSSPMWSEVDFCKEWSKSGQKF